MDKLGQECIWLRVVIEVGLVPYLTCQDKANQDIAYGRKKCESRDRSQLMHGKAARCNGQCHLGKDTLGR